MEPISLTKFSSKASSKEKIIDILSHEWPLKAKVIHNKLQKEYGKTISYQGTHKIIKELEIGKIVERMEDGYKLDVEWLQKSKKALEGVEKKYLQNNKIQLPEELNGSIEIEFETITDLCVSTAELLGSGKLLEGSEDKSYASVLEYGWWPFKFRFEHVKLLYGMAKNPSKLRKIIRKKTPFGKWVQRQYQRTHIQCAPIGTKVDIENDIIVQGPYIIEINFDPETKKQIEYYYNKWRNLNDCFWEFGFREEPKLRSTMKISKNPELARYLKKQFCIIVES